MVKDQIIQHLPICNIITLASIIILIDIFFMRLIEDDREYLSKLLNNNEFNRALYALQTSFFLILCGSLLSIAIIFALLFILLEQDVFKAISIGILVVALISLIIPMALLQYEVIRLLIKPR